MQRERSDTTIPTLLQVVEVVPRPRALVIGEGPLAGRLWRSLRRAVDRMAVSQPRRNRLISQDGDKDDPVDAEKLAHGLERAVFKEQVALYHHRARGSGCARVCACRPCSGSMAS